MKPTYLLNWPTCLIWAATIFLSCNSTAKYPDCPNAIKGESDSAASFIIFGEQKSPYLLGHINSVKAECIPIDNPAIKTEKFERDAFRTFDIAVTANIKYSIYDPIKFDAANQMYTGHQSGVIFEALSAGGVVFKSETVSFHFIRGGYRGDVSARLSGFNSDEISRVASVNVKWAYK